MFRRKSKAAAPSLSIETSLDPPTLPKFDDVSESPSRPTFEVSVPGIATTTPPPQSPAGNGNGNGNGYADGPKLRRRSSTQSKQRIQTSPGGTSFHKPLAYAATANSSRPISNANSFSYLPNGTSPTSPTRRSPSHTDHLARRSIASLYPSPSAYTPPLPSGLQATSINTLPLPKSVSLPNVRRAHKLPPALNVLVVGASHTGKTSFLRTLLASASATPVRANLLKGGKTKNIQSVSVDVLGRSEKFSLTVVDTPGLEIPLGDGSGRVGDELQVDKTLTEILKMVEGRFDDTLAAESNLFRPSHRTHDSHVHLAIYLLHPESISPRPSLSSSNSVRKPKMSLGSYTRSVSSPQLTTPKGSEENSETHSEKGAPKEEIFTMSPVDLRCITRLSRRVNVLPVLARSDTLTIAELAYLKSVIRTDLNKAGMGFATFGSKPASERQRGRSVNDHTRADFSTEEDEENEDEDEDEDEDEVEDEVEEVKVVKIRSRNLKRGTAASLSPTMKRMQIRDNDDYLTQEDDEVEVDEAPDYVEEDLPFGIVAPEPGGLVRQFRYGTLDVLNPLHSDFPKLRRALLGAQMSKLKESTRLEKYERFRTQRLIARQGVSGFLPEGLLKDLSAI